MKKEVFCIAEFQAIKWKEKELEKELKILASLNKEKGCEFYIPTKQIQNKYAKWIAFDFTFIEKFESVKAFNSHCEEQYVKDFFEKNANLIECHHITLHKWI